MAFFRFHLKKKSNFLIYQRNVKKKDLKMKERIVLATSQALAAEEEVINVDATLTANDINLKVVEEIKNGAL